MQSERFTQGSLSTASSGNNYRNIRHKNSITGNVYSSPSHVRSREIRNASALTEFANSIKPKMHFFFPLKRLGTA